MAATRLAHTAIETVPDKREAVAGEVGRYAGADLLCYHAEDPQALADLHAQRWTPELAWAEQALGVSLVATAGVIHRPQPPDSIARVKALALALDDFALTALAVATPLFGSAVLALGLQRGRLSGDEAFDLSRLDEAFQEERWGLDEEAAERTANRRREAQALDAWFKALRP